MTNASLKLQIIFCLHPCHTVTGRGEHPADNQYLVSQSMFWLVWDVWGCLSKFLASLLSCSWQLSFAGPGLVIVIAASSDHLLPSLPPLCPINPQRDQSSELIPGPQIFNAQMILDPCPTILSLSSPWPALRVPDAHFITQLTAVIHCQAQGQ